MFEAVEYVEPRHPAGSPVTERHLGLFPSEGEAVAAARTALSEFVAADRDDYAWWIVREPGARMAGWIADCRSRKEYVLDLTSGQLVETG